MKTNTCQVLNPNKKFGLIGKDISHSYSKELFELAYGAVQGKYGIIDMQNLSNVNDILAEYDGLNVTAPFKKDIVDKIQYFQKYAATIKSINCIKSVYSNDKKLLVGYNSDIFAIECICYLLHFGYSSLLDSLGNYTSIYNILEKNEELVEHNQKERKNALVFGYGGAGMAAIQGLINSGYRPIVWGRDSNKLRNTLLQIFGSYDKCLPLSDLMYGNLDTQHIDLVIYCLPMKNYYVLEMLRRRFFEKGLNPTIVEANYKNPCLAQITDRYIPGEFWLAMQAIAGFHFLTDMKPNVKNMANWLETKIAKNPIFDKNF